VAFKRRLLAVVRLAMCIAHRASNTPNLLVPDLSVFSQVATRGNAQDGSEPTD